MSDSPGSPTILSEGASGPRANSLRLRAEHRTGRCDVAFAGL